MTDGIRFKAGGGEGGDFDMYVCLRHLFIILHSCGRDSLRGPKRENLRNERIEVGCV